MFVSCIHKVPRSGAAVELVTNLTLYSTCLCAACLFFDFGRTWSSSIVTTSSDKLCEMG